MIITPDTTVKEILDARPEARTIFEAHGVDVPLECPECTLDSELSVCESMCHIDDLDVLITDLNKLFNSQA
jgi:hypothetical protein